MRWAWVWVGLAAAVVAAVLAVVWRQSDQTTASTLAAVVAAVAAVTGPLAGWLPTRADASDTIDNRLARLATVVRKQWNDEANVRQLHDPQPIALRWKTADPRLMDHAEVIAGGRPARRGTRPAGRLEEVVEEFLRLPRRRLVVIGEPGAGKTGLLLLLTLGLLARRTSADPVPVLFSLASWDPARTGFPQWLARHLSDEYPFVRPREAQRIVEAGRVLPVLDGLDELPARAAAAAVARINAAGLERPLVVASRTREFAQAVHAADVLTGAAVVELEPVPPDQAETYLRLSTPPDDRLARWEPVFAQLRRGPSSAMAAALATPLMVTLARTVYALDRGANPAELARCPSPEAVEDRLLDALVPALYAGSSRWSADRARSWLAFLAAHLRRRGTRDLAWWELAPRRGVSQIGTAVGLGLGFGFLAEAVGQIAHAIELRPLDFIIAYEMAWPGYRVVFDLGQVLDEVALILAPGIWTGIVAGTAGAVAVGLSLVGLPVRRPSRLVLRLDWPFRRRLLIGAVTGVAVLLAAASMDWIRAGVLVGGFSTPLVAIRFWLEFVRELTLLVGLPLSLGFGLIFGMLRLSEQPPTPNSSLASNRVVCITALLLVAGLSLDLVVGGSSNFPDGNPWNVVERVVAALGGLPIALGLAAVLPWGAYQFAHLWLALRGRLPWRLFAFLEDAHKRGVLRQVGGVYQFRHARLQDRLAGP